MKQQSMAFHEENNRDFFQAAIIDEQGQEIPITEAMIVQALEDCQEKQGDFFPDLKDTTSVSQ
ncbi:MAG: hypothetical protein K6L73_03815 [Cellvibrionaceae bacterium]